MKTRTRKKRSELSALHKTWTAEAAGLGWTAERLRRAVRLPKIRERGAPEQHLSPTGPAGRPGLAEPHEPPVLDADRHRPHRPAIRRQRWETRPLLPEHTRAIQRFDELRDERHERRGDRDALHRHLGQARQELEGLPRWARGRRRTLTDTLLSRERELLRTEPALASLDGEVDRLTRQVGHHTRQRLTVGQPGPDLPRPGR